MNIGLRFSVKLFYKDNLFLSEYYFIKFVMNYCFIIYYVKEKYFLYKYY